METAHAPTEVPSLQMTVAYEKLTKTSLYGLLQLLQYVMVLSKQLFKIDVLFTPLLFLENIVIIFLKFPISYCYIQKLLNSICDFYLLINCGKSLLNLRDF